MFEVKIQKSTQTKPNQKPPTKSKNNSNQFTKKKPTTPPKNTNKSNKKPRIPPKSNQIFKTPTYFQPSEVLFDLFGQILPRRGAARRTRQRFRRDFPTQGDAAYAVTRLFWMFGVFLLLMYLDFLVLSMYFFF